MHHREIAMFYLVLHFVGRNGQILTVYDCLGNSVRAEFSTLRDAEMARYVVEKFNSHSAFIRCDIERD